MELMGERLREARRAKQLSLNEVAARADISASTLSRIETNKQNLDLGLFVALAKILDVTPGSLFDHVGEDGGPLAARISALSNRSRTELWRELTAAQKTGRRSHRRSQLSAIAQQMEELVAQIEFITQEIESVRMAIRRRT